MRTPCTTSCSLKKSLSEDHIPCSCCSSQVFPPSCNSECRIHSRICKGQLASSDSACSICLSRACALLGMLNTAPPALRALAASSSVYSNAALVSRSSSGTRQHITTPYLCRHRRASWRNRSGTLAEICSQKWTLTYGKDWRLDFACQMLQQSCFSEVLHEDVTVHFQLICMPHQTFVWISHGPTQLGQLCAAVPQARLQIAAEHQHT